MREFHAITAAMAKFRHYLLGHQFILRTDQKSLRSLLDQSLQTPEQQAWLHKFMGSDFKIEYKPGRDNQAADALSRVMNLAWSEPQVLFVQQLKEEMTLDNELQQLMQDCQAEDYAGRYTTKDGLLFYDGRLVIPMQSKLIQQILHEFHSSPVGGHAGIARTVARITPQFFWRTLRSDVKTFVANCVICQQAKTVNTAPAGLLQPLPIPQQAWDDVSMDFITGLPISFGFTVILVVVDRLTKYAHFMGLKTDYTSKSVAELFMANVVKLHGMPKSIVSDRDRVFTSKFWQHLFQLQGTTLAMSSAYHPQSDGQTEAVNKCVEMFLRCFTADNPKSWYKALNWAEYWYNSSFHTSIGMTPFKALYGRDPPMVVQYKPSSNEPPELQTQLLLRDKILADLKNNLQRAQQNMKATTDRKRTDVKYELGDLVLVKLQPYRQNSAALRKHQKLGMRYFGPFPIIAKVGQVAYKLQLPNTAKIHHTFHVSQLKKFKGHATDPYLPLPLTTMEEGPIIQPEKILQTRTVLRGTQQVPQVLVKWEGLPSMEASWEDRAAMLDNFPTLNLEDKVAFKGDGIVMNENVIEGTNGTEVDAVEDTRQEGAVRRSTRPKRDHPMWGEFVKR